MKSHSKQKNCHFSTTIQTKTKNDDIIAEWANQYVDMDAFNQDIARLVELNQAEKMNQRQFMYKQQELERQYTEIEFGFWTRVDKDLAKIETFYRNELDSASKRVLETQQVVTSKHLISQQRQIPVIEENITEIYRGLDLLVSYCSQNEQNFHAVVKTWDANNTRVRMGEVVLKNKLNQLQFPEPEEIDFLKEKLEAALGIILDLPQPEIRNRLSKIHRQSVGSVAKTFNSWISGFLACCTIILVSSFVQNIDLTSLCKSAQLVIRCQMQIGCVLLSYGALAYVCEAYRINYPYLLEIPSEIEYDSAKIIRFGFTYVSLTFFFANLSAASADSTFVIQFPFGEQLKILAQQLKPNVWLSIAATIHLSLIYLTVLQIFENSAPGFKHMLDIVYKTIIPWAHQVNLNNFFMGTLTTSIGRFIKDIVLIVTKQQSSDLALCTIAAYPSLIRFIQCYVKYKPTRKFYPHFLNGSFNLLGIIGCYLGSNFVKSKPFLFWTIFSVRIIEIGGKVYWDYWEDAALFHGGFGVIEFKELQQKWRYGKFCRRPSLIPLWIYIVYLIYNTVSRLLWLDILFSESDFVKNYWYSTVIALNEIFRRFFWALSRLDNQQATNCENYMATRYVPVLIENVAQKVKKISQIPGQRDEERVGLINEVQKSIQQVQKGLSRSIHKDFSKARDPMGGDDEATEQSYILVAKSE